MPTRECTSNTGGGLSFSIWLGRFLRVGDVGWESQQEMAKLLSTALMSDVLSDLSGTVQYNDYEPQIFLAYSLLLRTAILPRPDVVCRALNVTIS